MPEAEQIRALPTGHGSVDYYTFLPWLASFQSVTNYLEVGVNMGQLIKKMHIKNVIGVDPNFIINENIALGKENLFLIQKTSDRFFKEDQALLKSYPPQLAFLDGMHLFEYLLRDFLNTEAACNRHSLIVMHDCLPMTPGMCHRIPEGSFKLTEGTPYYGMWTGDVWKVVPILKKYRPDLRIVCVDAGPTGLVCVTNLDPSSTVLDDRYLEIVDEWSEVPDTVETIGAMYGAIDLVSAADMMAGLSHGFHFRN